MSPNEIQEQLHALTLAQKAMALQTLTQSLHNGAKGISKTAGVCGGSACIAGTRIPVWLLVEARQLSIPEAQLLSDYPHLSAADLVNAWAYAEAYSDEIEAAIRRNEVA